MSLVVINESPPHAVTLQVTDTEEGEPAEGATTSPVGGWRLVSSFAIFERNLSE